MAKFSCEIKELLVLGANPSFLYKKNVYSKLHQHTAFDFQLGHDISFDLPLTSRRFSLHSLLIRF